MNAIERLMYNTYLCNEIVFRLNIRTGIGLLSVKGASYVDLY